MSDPRAVLRIGEVSRRTGVAVPTLRAWERRYGLLHPERTDGGHRLYREADVERVRSMSRLLGGGWSAAAAAREVLRSPAPVTHLRPVPGSGSGSAAAGLVERLSASVDSFDAATADRLVDDVLARFQIPAALDEVLLPVLRHLGDGWQDDPRVIAREHFATNTLRPRLQRLLRTAVRSSGGSVLAAAPESEEHDLGLLAAAAVAADAGWRVHYLGPRTPVAALERGAAELDPDVVLIGALFRAHAESFLAVPPRFERAGLVLGGVGFLAADAARIPGAVVHEGPMRSLPESLSQAATARGTVSG